MLGNAAAPGAAWRGNTHNVHCYTRFLQHSCPFKACSDKAPKLQPFVQRIVRSQKPSVQGTQLELHNGEWLVCTGFVVISELESVTQI